MTVTVNSNVLTLPEEANVDDALRAAGISTQGVAIALNGAVVRAAKRPMTRLKDGDAILVIQAFFGG